MPSSSAKLPSWYRALALIVGVISIALAFVVLIDPVLAVATLILLLGFALLVIGIDRIVAGITGHPFGLMVPSMSPGGPSGPGGAGPGSASGPSPPARP